MEKTSKKIQNLLQSEYFDPEDSASKSYQILGTSTFQCMTANVLLFQIPKAKTNQAFSLPIPDISDEVIQSLSIHVQKNHFYMCLGKIYHQKNIKKIIEVQTELKQFLMNNSKIQKLNLSNISVQTSGTIQKGKNNSFNEQTSFLQRDQSFEESIPSLKLPSQKVESKQMSLTDKFKSYIMSKDSQNSTIKQVKQSMGFTSILNQLENSEMQSFEKNPNVQTYLNGIKSFATEMNHLNQHFNKGGAMQELVYELLQNKQWVCRVKFVIKEFDYYKIPPYFEGKGQATKKQNAKQLCFRQILSKVYASSEQLWRTFMNQMQNIGLKN